MESIEELIDSLLDTSERLDQLTGGQVDTVTDRGGRVFVLMRAQQELRNSDAIRQAGILNALSGHIALLDVDGTILSVNAAWREFAAKHHFRSPTYGQGMNYLAVCDRAIGFEAPDARAAATGIRDVLAGRASHFELEYAVATQGTDYWFRMVVTPVNAGQRDGAVVLHDDISSEKRAQFSVRDSEQRFRQMAENISDVFFLRDRSGTTLYVSPAYEKIWGASCDSLYADGRSWINYIHPDDRERVDEDAAQETAEGGFNREFRIVRTDGSVRWIKSRGFPVRNAEGEVVRIAGIASDITERHVASSRIQYLNRVYAMLTAINSVMLRARDRTELFAEACRVAVDAGGFKAAWIGTVSRTAAKLDLMATSGVGNEFLAGLDMSLDSQSMFGRGLTGRALRDKHTEIANDLTNAPSVSLSERHLSQGIRSLAIVPLVVNDEAMGVLALYAGETEFFHDEELVLLDNLAHDIAYAVDHLDRGARLNYLSYYDQLTGLPNRQLFLERVTAHMQAAAVESRRMALFVVDLERFKNVNDSLGRLAGDALLRKVADYIVAAIGNASLVARIGADRFAVVMPDVREEGNVVSLVEKLLTAFGQQAFDIDDTVVRMATKAGGAFFPEDGADPELLFQNAESALKNAKAGGDRYLFFQSSMAEASAGALTLETRLRMAYDRNEFVLYYQPKINTQTGVLTGAEALIRWNDPVAGLVPPGDFIPMLESTGLIHDVGRWALETAIADHARWRQLGLRAVRIAVNVSPVQLRTHSFVADVRRATLSDRHAASGIELEVTEGLVMEDIEHGSANLQAIHALGVRIAIDDFGTGFSSLSYLSRLPVDALKIDRSFITNMTESKASLTLVSTIIALAHSLDLTVIAEGVETAEQARLLRMLDCNEMQGYLCSKPLPRAEFEASFLGPSVVPFVIA